MNKWMNITRTDLHAFNQVCWLISVYINDQRAKLMEFVSCAVYTDTHSIHTMDQTEFGCCQLSLLTDQKRRLDRLWSLIDKHLHYSSLCPTKLRNFVISDWLWTAFLLSFVCLKCVHLYEGKLIKRPWVIICWIAFQVWVLKIVNYFLLFFIGS